MRRTEAPGCDSAKNARPTPSANPLSSILNGGEGRGEGNSIKSRELGAVYFSAAACVASLGALRCK